VAGLGLLEAHQEFAISIQPGMSPFDAPSSCLIAGLVAFGGGLFFALLDVRPVLARHGCLAGRIALVSCIGAQALWLPLARLWTLAHHAVQSGGQQLHVMYVGSADGERQRDATPVH